jgi:hypothetical protein
VNEGLFPITAKIPTFLLVLPQPACLTLSATQGYRLCGFAARRPWFKLPAERGQAQSWACVVGSVRDTPDDTV